MLAHGFWEVAAFSCLCLEGPCSAHSLWRSVARVQQLPHHFLIWSFSPDLKAKVWALDFLNEQMSIAIFQKTNIWHSGVQILVPAMMIGATSAPKDVSEAITRKPPNGLMIGKKESVNQEWASNIKDVFGFVYADSLNYSWYPRSALKWLCCHLNCVSKVWALSLWERCSNNQN